jgi:Insecticide toxin TcdB middle/N-terminal region
MTAWNAQYTSPPGGSGVGSGQGETFSINLGTGTAMHSYKLQVPDGVAGHTPALALDVDGDGCADLVLLSGQGITVVQNRNGMSFAPPVALPLGPPPMTGTVRAVNMDGAATTGLVWNTNGPVSPRYAHWHTVAAEPAYLLSRVDNGAGLTSEIRYRSAIEDHRRDHMAGAAWTTNFPFPYVVVAGTSETDHLSGRRTEVEHRYHEAHFVEHKTYTYDAVGNVVREERRGSGIQGGTAVPERVEVREVMYAASATHYLLDRSRDRRRGLRDVHL